MNKEKGKRVTKKIEKWLQGMILALPVVMYFSYHPVITLGTSDKLNLEISLVLIWLVIFDILV